MTAPALNRPVDVQSERELLELAAKAVGYDANHPMNRERMAFDPPVVALWVRNDKGLIHTGWNPLESDADALRLLVKLQLLVDVKDGVTDCVGPFYWPEGERHDGEPEAATRRAIVRAAAAIGSAK